MERQEIKILDRHGVPMEKAAPAIDLSFSRQGGGRSTTALTADLIETQPYKYHAWVYACAAAIVKNISRLPFVLYKEDDPDTIINKHEILTVLEHPNSLMSRTNFIQAILLGLLLPSSTRGGVAQRGGQSFLIAYDGEGNSVDLVRGGIPPTIVPYTDAFVNPVTSNSNNGMSALLGYKFEVPGSPDSKKLYGINEAIRIYMFNPYNWLEGLAAFHPAAVAVDQDIKADVYNSRLFVNNAIPSGLLSTEQDLTDEQASTMRKRWYNQMGGPGNVGGLAVLHRGVKYQHVGMSAADMQYGEMKKDVQEQVISSYGLNKIALGQYEQINYATIVEGRRMLWQDAYAPIAEMVCEAINSQWIRYVEQGLRIKFDVSGIEYLRKDYSVPVRAAGNMVQQMNLPASLAARIAGLPITEKDIKQYPWLDQNPAELKAAGFGLGATTEALRSVVEGKPVNLPKLLSSAKPKQASDVQADELIEARNEAFWKDYVERVLDPQESSFQKELIRFFYEQRNAMQDKVDSWAGKQKKEAPTITKAVKIDVDAFLLSPEAETEKLAELGKKMTGKQLRLSEKKLKEELGGLVNWNVTDEMIGKYVKKRMKQYKEINTYTFKKCRNDIGKVIEDAMAESWTVQETAKAIKQAISHVGEIRKNQSRTIARTEIGSVTSQSRFDAFKAEGYELHRWITSGDEKVRDSHVQQGADGNNTIAVGDEFEIVNLQYPLDPSGAPEEIINCRCVTVVVAKDE